MKHSQKVYLSVLTVILLVIPAFAAIINVPGDQPTIQAGIDSAFTGDTVLVDTGMYFENVDFNGKSIVVASHFILIQDTSKIVNTVINGMTTGTVVSIKLGEDSTTSIEGFTILDGYSGNGGGIWCSGGSKPLIRNNIVMNNSTSSDGAGIFINGGAAPTVVWNIIKYNDAGVWGGGIYVFDGSSPYISRNVIFNNGVTKSLQRGYENTEKNEMLVVGGRLCNPGEVNVPRTTNGGGILVTNYGSQPTYPAIINNTIDGNYGSGDGGGIFCNNALPDIRNNILTNNDKYGIFAQTTTIEVTYNDVWNNTTANYSGTVTVGVGNISDDPLFVNPTLENYHIQFGSPCIDTADPGTPLDPDSTRADMGAYYYHQTGVEEEPSSGKENNSYFTLILAGPLQLPKDKNCKVFDITGKAVKPLNLIPGIYFVEIEGSIRQKVIKIK